MKGGHVRTGLPDWDNGQDGTGGVEGREQACPAMVQHTVIIPNYIDVKFVIESESYNYSWLQLRLFKYADMLSQADSCVKSWKIEGHN